MKKTFLIFVKISFLFLSITIYGQRFQKIGYVDMTYILEQMPIYKKSQKILDEKIKLWKEEIKMQAQEIQNLKNAKKKLDYQKNKKIIAIKESIILQKQKEMKIKKEKYFGKKGLIFKLRSELLQPLQDEIFKAIKEIATLKKYDFIFDTSESFSVLYANPMYDLNDLVLKKVKRNLKNIEH